MGGGGLVWILCEYRETEFSLLKKLSLHEVEQLFELKKKTIRAEHSLGTNKKNLQ